MSGATTNGVIPPWKPDELNPAWASAASIVLCGLIVGGIIYAGAHLPKPHKTVIAVTEVHMVQLPKPPPPKPLPKPPPSPPPPPVPIPKPVPLPVIRHPVPVPTRIPLPPKPVVIHRRPPPKHVVIRHPPPPQVRPPPRPAPRPQPPPQPAFNAEAYGAALRGPIQRNVHVTRAMEMLGVKGIVYIAITIMPDGHAISARIYRSSGNPLVDKAGLNAVKETSYPPFPGSRPIAFVVPIEIVPGGSDG